MKISPLVIESIDTNTVDIDSCWLWSSSEIYNPDYSSTLAQPVSIEAISLNDLRWKSETTTLTLRSTDASDSPVVWSGYVELFPEPDDGVSISTEVQYYTGIIDAMAPAMIDNPDGSIYMSSCNVALNTKPDHTGDTKTFLVTGKQLVPVDGVTSYVAIRYNSGSPEYYIELDARNLNGSDVAAVYAVWRVGTEIHSVGFDSRGIGLPNKTAVMLTNTRPYNLAYGQSLVLSERSTPFPRLINVTAALVYAGVDAQQVLAFDSIEPGNRLTKVYHVAGVWTYDSSSGAYDNLNYDNGTNLVSMSGINKYSTRWFYRTIGDDRQVFYICGNEYNTVHAAQQESIPTGIPTVVQSHAVLLGRIIIQYGADSGIVENVVTTSFNTIPVLNHNSLTGLQGVGPDYYHLDATQYAWLLAGPYLPLDGTSPMTGDITSHSIRPETNTTYDLGAPTHRYATIYSSTLNTTGLVSGTSYIGSIIPYNNESFYYDIGTNLYRYNRIYAKDITINGFSTTASSIDIGAGYRINLSGYLSSQPQMNWPTNYSSSVVAGDMSWDGTKLKVGDGTVQRTFAYTSDITSQSLSGFTVGTNTAIVQSDSILQAFQKTQGQINARALSSDLGNYLTKVNPTYIGRLTGPEQYIENDGQILLAIRRPGGNSGRTHGIAFQAQTLDSTWVEFGRVVTYISSVANGAQTGGMRLMSYNAGVIVTALDAGPTGVTFEGLLSGPRAYLSEFGTLAALPTDSNYASIHATGVTRTGTNYAVRIADDGSDTMVNAATAVALAIAGTSKLGVTTSAVNLGSGVALQFNGTTVIDSLRNATFNTFVASQGTIGSTQQESVMLRRPNATTNLLWGVDFQGQTNDLTWVNYNRIQSRTVSTANGAQTGYLRMVNYNGGVAVVTVEIAPTVVNFASGVELQMNGSRLVSSSKDINMGATLTLTTTTVQTNITFRNTTEHWTSFYAQSNEAGFRDYNADGSSNSYPLYWTLKTGGLLRITRPTNFLSTVQINGTQIIDTSRNATFNSGTFTTCAGVGYRPLVVNADGTIEPQSAATFRTTIEVLPYKTLTGAIDFNSIESGNPGNYKVQGTSYTNAPAGASSSVSYDLWQGSAGGRLVQRLTDTWWGGAYHRFQIGTNSGAWSPWLDILDSGLLPTTTLTRSFLATSTTAAARAAINAAANPDKTTKNGSWTLDTSTPLCIVQTATGTLTLPAASSTYQTKSYIITATTTVTLTIAGSYCYLDSPNSSSYWYDTVTNVSFTMSGGHSSGSRKMIEIWCDGVEWYVRC